METANPRLVVATGNAKKLKELQATIGGSLTGPRAPELVTTVALGLESPEETGLTFEANAIIKARAAYDATGLPSLADDSGLEVDALGGAPGVWSARFAGPDADDAANNAKLMAMLAGVPPERRTARFRCCIAIVFDKALADQVPGARYDDAVAWVVTSGAVEGHIVEDARGQGGFGYDPWFFHGPSGCTFAELSIDAKRDISHRGRALALAMPALTAIFS